MILLGLFTLACHGTTSPHTTVDGNWQGSTQGQTLTITLTSSGQSVNGSGTIAPSGSAGYALTIGGTYVVPTLAVTLTSAQHPSISLAATLGNDILAGALNGAGFADAVIVLRRM
jgi:hypothetical protein